MKKNDSRQRGNQALSPEGLSLVAARFKALSDPMRLRMLQHLQLGETSVSALAEFLQTTQPNVSRHLKILQHAGLLSRRQEGNSVYYSISDPTVFELCSLVCSSLQERIAAQANIFTAASPLNQRRRKG